VVRGQLLLEPEQGAHRVDGGPGRVRLPEDVVEHLERQRPGVAAGEHRPGEGDQVERALPGEEPVVAAPLQHIHGELRRVGELDEEQLLGGNGGEPSRIPTAGQHVEAVQAQAQRGGARA